MTGRRDGLRTREEILGRSMQVASVDGLEGVTIGRLAGDLGMSKSGVIGHFGSKESLQLATVGAAGAVFVEQILEPVRGQEPGLARLTAALDAWITYLGSGTFDGGCFFCAVSTEVDGRPGPVRDSVVAVTRAGWDFLVDEARLAQRLGEIDDGVDPEQLVFELHAYLQEANWMFQLYGRHDALARARTAVQRRLADASPDAGGKRR